MPEKFPSALSGILSGSVLVRTVANGFDTPIPPAGAKGVKPVFEWIFFAAPVWGLALIVIVAPLLPTMVLAGMFIPVFFLLLLSRRFNVNYLTVFLFGFILVNFYAGITSFTPWTSIQIAVLVSVFMLTAAALPACCRSENSVDFFVLAFLFGAGLTGLVGFWQVFSGHATNLWIDQETFTDIPLRVYSTLENPNVYGTYLLLAIPLAAACVVFFKNIFLKICAGGLTLLLLANLILTYSRGCYLALAIAAGIFVLVMEKRFVVLFIPVLAAMPFLLPASVMNRFMSILNFGPNMDSSTVFRLHIWRGSLRILRDFWMSGLGQGIEAYNHVYPFYGFAAVPAPHSHNLFIQIFVELGIVGLLVFIGLLACFFRTMVNFLRRKTELRLRIMAAAIISAVIGFLFQGIFDYVFYNYRVLLSFYIFLGIAIAFAKVYEKND
jgi:putative inorganic carbon (HCO3(-)) transporter